MCVQQHDGKDADLEEDVDSAVEDFVIEPTVCHQQRDNPLEVEAQPDSDAVQVGVATHGASGRD